MTSTATSSPARVIGRAAGFLPLIALLGVLLGALWALLRPTLVGVLDPDSGGYLIVAGRDDAQFLGFISFIGLCALVGLASGLLCFSRAAEHRSIAMLCWSAVVATLGAVAIYASGGIIADLLRSTDGEHTRFVPPVMVSVGWVVAPFMATLSYWCAALLSTPEQWMRPSEPVDTGTPYDSSEYR